ncbi:DNA-processing protein DprA [Candidatus Latescibacterota bacterium]
MTTNFNNEDSIQYEYDGSDSYDDRQYYMQGNDPFSNKKLSNSDYTQYAIEHLEEIHVDNINYPEQYKSFWGSKLPQTLFCMGNNTLLRNKIVMVCGSRNVSELGLETAYKCGRLIAEMGFTVASGYARGVDMAAHQGALEGGGDTIAILPYGLGKFKKNGALSSTFDFNKFLAVSELPVTYPFTAGSALRRNKLLVALSQAVIVVESQEKGGTWFSARYAGKKEKPLFFFEGMRKDVAPKLRSIGGVRLQIKNGAPDLRKIEKLFNKRNMDEN